MELSWELVGKVAILTFACNMAGELIARAVVAIARKRARKAVEVGFRVDGYDERGRPFQTIDGIINGKAGSVRVYPMANGRIPNPPISAQPQWDRAPAIQPRFPRA